MDANAIGLYNIALGTGSVLLVLIGIVFVNSHAKPRHKRPPGPKGLPIVGNLFQIPSQVSKNFRFLSTYIDGKWIIMLAPCHVLPIAAGDIRWTCVSRLAWICA